MFLKGTLAAGIMAAALAFMPEAATAKTKVYIGIGGGSDWCFHHPYSTSCRFGHGGYGGGYGYYQPPIGYYPAPHYLPQRWYSGRISCGEAKEIVQDHGYRKVRTRNCGGSTSSFVGLKRGHLWLVKVNTRNGRIAGARPL